MPPDPASNVINFEQRFNFVERDVRSHAKTLTAHNEALNKYERDLIRHEEREKRNDERLQRIEESIKSFHKLGWWILSAFGASFIALLANFLFRGGFVV